jgi:hypothetical protein
MVLAQADADALATKALADQLEGILHTGSTVEKFCYLQIAAKRRREEEQRAAEGAGPGEYRGPKSSPLDSVLYRLEAELLAEETLEREGKANSRVEGIGEVLGMCELVRNDAKDVLDLHIKKNYRHLERFRERQQQQGVNPTGASVGAPSRTTACPGKGSSFRGRSKWAGEEGSRPGGMGPGIIGAAAGEAELRG